MATELELKLMVQSEYLKSASDFLDEICIDSDNEKQGRQATLSLMNAYFDTEEADLMKAGIAMRIRAVNNTFIQTVKTRGSNRVGMHARGEWEWQVPSDKLDFSLLAEVPLPDELKDMSWSNKLLEVYRTDFERQVWNIETQDSAMEVVCDHGVVTSPYGEDSISELELELKKGSEIGLYHFALELAQQVPVQVSTVSKAQKGVRLKYGQIEFPEKPFNVESKLELAFYWYEVWLVYWEAMHFMQDEALVQPVRHSIEELGKCLPNELQEQLLSLNAQLDEHFMEEEQLMIKKLMSMTSVGIVMLEIGLWLNKQVHAG